MFPEDGKAAAERPEPDWAHIHAELKKKGVTSLPVVDTASGEARVAKLFVAVLGASNLTAACGVDALAPHSVGLKA